MNAMRMRAWIAFLSAAIFIISGCTNSKEAALDASEETVYYGQGQDWLATFSIFKVNDSLFDSIYIQHIGADRESPIGKIEYRLTGGDGFVLQSQYPLPLQGVGSYHSSSEANAEFFSIQPMDDGSFKLTVKYKEKTEDLSLFPITDN